MDKEEMRNTWVLENIQYRYSVNKITESVRVFISSFKKMRIFCGLSFCEKKTWLQSGQWTVRRARGARQTVPVAPKGPWMASPSARPLLHAGPLATLLFLGLAHPARFLACRISGVHGKSTFVEWPRRWPRLKSQPPSCSVSLPVPD